MIATQDNLQARLYREGLVTVTEAARGIPARAGKKVAATTVWRWVTAGHHGVRLEGFQLPRGDWVTSVAALGRFFAAVGQGSEPEVCQLSADAEQQALAELLRQKRRTV